MNKIGYLISMRDKARAQGDRNQARAIEADLARLGYREDAAAPMETAAYEAPERAEDKRRGGRPRLPRCEHDQIVGRCAACEEDDE
jgi:hypothetical protein